MTSNILIQFNHAATTLNLSGRQMQLWMSLYEIITTHQQQDMALYTPLLLRKVQLCKRQFLRVRQALVDAGFLAVRHDENQQIRYTLLLNNEEIAVATMVDDVMSFRPEHSDVEKSLRSLDCARDDMMTPTRNDRPAPTAYRDDMMMSFRPERSGVEKSLRSLDCARDDKPAAKLNRQDYYEAIEDFCQSYNQPPMLLHSLQQWAEMRLQNGWQLTAWGLESLLENLQEIAAGSVENMIATVKKSIRRRWKGFFSYTPDSRPNGEKLRKLEEKEERAQQNHRRSYGGVTQKFKNEGRDLSFLVQ